MTTYRYRPSRIGNNLVLQRKVINTAGRDWWVDALLTDMPTCYIKPTSSGGAVGGTVYWRLRPGWFGTLVLQRSETGTDYRWDDARLQDLSASPTVPVPA